METLAPGGTVMLVEPFARDRLEDNFSVVGQLYYAASSLICCAHAIAEGGKHVLGAQAGPKRLEATFRMVGFTRFRQAAETPFTLVFEIRRCWKCNRVVVHLPIDRQRQGLGKS